MYTERVKIYCNQSGEAKSVKVNELSHEDGQLEQSNKFNGAQLYYEENGHSYPVTVVEASVPPTKPKQTKRNRDAVTVQDNALKLAKEEVSMCTVLVAAIHDIFHPSDMM